MIFIPRMALAALPVKQFNSSYSPRSPLYVRIFNSGNLVLFCSLLFLLYRYFLYSTLFCLK
uniref:Uncharacterized protein n=1 Tax=Heterorhabditis bacteriophora TaxID=37862 RepID=A0A1I7WGY9_HETBA